MDFENYGILFDPNPSDKSEDTPKGESNKTEPKEEPKSTKQKYNIKGRPVELEPHEVDALLNLGADKYLEEEEKAKKPKKEVEETEDDKLSSKYATKEELAQERLERHRLQLNRELKELADSHELTKEPDMADAIRTLVLSELQKNPNADLAETYKKKVKFLGDKMAKSKSEYVDNKIKDAQSTKSPSPGSSPGMKPDKPTGKGIMSGAVRRGVMEKFKSGVYK